LSSYAWLLLVINYLQRVGFLPVLQQLAPDGSKAETVEALPTVPETGSDGRVFETYFFADADSPLFQGAARMRHVASNSHGLRAGERLQWSQQLLRVLAAKCPTCTSRLLAGFFWDLSYGLDWRRHVVSVRTGGLVAKHVKAAEDSWRLHPRCAIEDPFEVSYDVSHVLRDGTFKTIRLEAARAYALLTGIHADVHLEGEACVREICRQAELEPGVEGTE
jgi:DNA polymerase sigma